MIPFIYIIIIVAWLFFWLAFKIESYAILFLSSFLLISIGIYMVQFGLSDIVNFITEVFGIIHIGIGFFGISWGGVKFIEDNF